MMPLLLLDRRHEDAGLQPSTHEPCVHTSRSRTPCAEYHSKSRCSAHSTLRNTTEKLHLCRSDRPDAAQNASSDHPSAPYSWAEKHSACTRKGAKHRD